MVGQQKSKWTVKHRTVLFKQIHDFTSAKENLLMNIMIRLN